MKKLALLVAVTLLPGCYRIHYFRGGVSSESKPQMDHWHHNALNGVFEASSTEPIDAYCSNGLARVETEVSAGNAAAEGLIQIGWFLSAFVGGAMVSGGDPGFSSATAGILGAGLWVWQPSTVRVYCAQAGANGPATHTSSPSTPPAAPRKPAVLRYAVVPLTPRAGIAPDVAELYTDALVGELRKRKLSVMSSQDIQALLGYEKQKALLGCTDESCLAEIGGALGVDRLVSGTVGRVDGTLVVTLSLVDPRRARTVNSVYEQLKNAKEGQFLDALPRFVTQLVDEPK